MGLYIYRLIGAATLDASMYEGIEVDRTATVQAGLTVLLSSVATGVALTARYGLGPAAFVVISGLALLTWVVWAVLMCQIGSRLLPDVQTETDLGELLRTLGFAAAPGLLQVLAALPFMAVPILTITAVWMFAAMVVAVQHALDYRHTGRALAVCALGASLCLAIAFSLGLLFSRNAS